jgi:putative transcriptional regulator
VPIKYKINVIAALKAMGYSTYRLRKDKLFGEGTTQKLREGKPVSLESIAVICSLLDCQPGDIIEYVPDIRQNENKPLPVGTAAESEG